jgi:hypothetical protein
MFVALTRAVREASVSEGARLGAYNIVDRMAHVFGQPGFDAELEALIACASQEPRFFEALQPFWDELRALSSAPMSRAKGDMAD